MTPHEWIQSLIGLATLICVVIGLLRGRALAISIDGRVEALLATALQSADDQDAVGEKRGRDSEIARRKS